MHGAGHVWPPVGTGAPSDYSASEAVWAFFSGLRAAPLNIGTDASVSSIAVKQSGSKRTVITTVSLKEPTMISSTFGTTRTRLASKVYLGNASRFVANLSIPSATKGGTYLVTISIADTYGRKLSVSRRVRVPSPPKPRPKKHKKKPAKPRAH